MKLLTTQKCLLLMQKMVKNPPNKASFLFNSSNLHQLQHTHHSIYLILHFLLSHKELPNFSPHLCASPRSYL
ncbi:hypothetical protein vseg_005998 [Gypsophila vaccaria]